METITKNAEETHSFGQKIGTHLKSKFDFSSRSLVLGLTGDLGSGKTTFVQGSAVGLGIKNRILSPTFVLVRLYQQQTVNLYHVDLYRLEKVSKGELESLGLSDFWEESGNIIVIEWAERARQFLPSDTVWMEFATISETDRKIKVEGLTL